MPTDAASKPDNYIFLRRESLGTNAILWGIIGAIAIVWGLLAFALCLMFSHVIDPVSLQCFVTMPTLLGIFSLAACWNFATAPLQVAVGPAGISIIRKKGRMK